MPTIPPRKITFADNLVKANGNAMQKKCGEQKNYSPKLVIRDDGNRSRIRRRHIRERLLP